jgi:hypothetical protein
LYNPLTFLGQRVIIISTREEKEMTKRFITVTEGMSGFFAVHMWLNQEEDCGDFWEPYDSGIGRYATREEAEVEARQWAEMEGMEYRA